MKASWIRYNYATGLGIKTEDIRVDPIILPISADQKQCREALEFIKILPDLLPGVKSLIGLSNVSNGAPGPLRGILNRTYLIMMERYGLYSAIVDVLDAGADGDEQGRAAGDQAAYLPRDGRRAD